jgi:hypothetical protein
MWSVANHIKRIRMPKNPTMKNNNASNEARNFWVNTFFEKLKNAINTNKQMNKKNGWVKLFFSFCE